MPTLPATLLTTLTTRRAAAPALTWYGADGERVELSGRVLGNWATKAANLLLEEADAGPGTWVHVDLPVHWRAVVWTLGSWLAGSAVVLAEPGAADEAQHAAEADVVVTARPEQVPEGPDLVLAVALPALAMRWDGSALPGGVVDAAAELMSYGDTLGYVQEPGDGDVALAGSEPVRYGELERWAGAGREVPEGARVLLSPSSVRDLLGQALAVWHRGGSVVLVVPGHPDVERIAREEGAAVA